VIAVIQTDADVFADMPDAGMQAPMRGVPSISGRVLGSMERSCSSESGSNAVPAKSLTYRERSRCRPESSRTAGISCPGRPHRSSFMEKGHSRGFWFQLSTGVPAETRVIYVTKAIGSRPIICLETEPAIDHDIASGHEGSFVGGE